MYGKFNVLCMILFGSGSMLLSHVSSSPNQYLAQSSGDQLKSVGEINYLDYCRQGQ